MGKKKKRCAWLSGLSYCAASDAGSLLIVHIINTTLSVFLVSSGSSEIQSCAASRTTAAVFLFVRFKHEPVCLFQQVMWSRLPMRNNIYFLFFLTKWREVQDIKKKQFFRKKGKSEMHFFFFFFFCAVTNCTFNLGVYCTAALKRMN